MALLTEFTQPLPHPSFVHYVKRVAVECPLFVHLMPINSEIFSTKFSSPQKIAEGITKIFWTSEFEEAGRRTILRRLVRQIPGITGGDLEG